MTTQTLIDTRIGNPILAHRPSPCDKVVYKGRSFTVTAVYDDSADDQSLPKTRLLGCVAHDTGLDAMLFWSEIDYCVPHNA